MVVDGRWTDVCILNLSSRGLMLQMAVPPRSGQFVEIRRGSHVIVARVVWSRNHRFGVRTQDSVPVASLINEPDLSQAPAGSAHDRRTLPERRTSPRCSARQHDLARTRSRILSFTATGLISVVFAATLLSMVNAALTDTFSLIEQALGK